MKNLGHARKKAQFVRIESCQNKSYSPNEDVYETFFRYGETGHDDYLYGT